MSSCNSKFSVLVFSKTAGFRHESIKVGKLALIDLGKKNNFYVDTTENSAAFSEKNLKKYKVIVFLSTTGDILNNQQQSAFEKYIQSGGGFVGIHAASDTEYDWAWYCSLVGGNFLGHPEVQNADLQIIDNNHASTNFLQTVWKRKDEWYNFKNLNPNTKTIIKIDEKTYNGGSHSDFHPMCWYHSFDGGRAFYTALGHTNESYAEELFLKHVLGGIIYAAGK